MTPEQIKYAFTNKGGVENLAFVQLNNSKTLTLTKEDRKNLVFNYDMQIIEFDEQSYGKNMHYVVPFDVIEGLIFLDVNDVKKTYEMQGNKLKVDEKGNPVTEW